MMERGKKILLFLLLLACVVSVHARVVKVGVLLPLKEQTAKGEKMMEFYRGFLLAADSLRYEGATVELSAFHSGSTASDMDMLLATEDLTGCDVIFGPLYLSQLPRLTDYCITHQIKLVVPFSADHSQLSFYDKYYMVSAPRSVVQQETTWFLSQHFSNCQVVIATTGERSTEGNAFVEMIKVRALQLGTPVKTISMSSTPQSILDVVDNSRRNVFVLDASSLKALSISLPILKSIKNEHPEIDMCLLGYPQWQTFTERYMQDFYTLDTYIYTSFYAHPSDVKHKSLVDKFSRWFHKPMVMSFPCYGLMGFDIGYYFMKGIQLYGSDFDPTTDFVNTAAYQHPLWFEKTEEGKAMVNRFVELVRYSPAQMIELVTRNR